MILLDISHTEKYIQQSLQISAFSQIHIAMEMKPIASNISKKTKTENSVDYTVYLATTSTTFKKCFIEED